MYTDPASSANSSASGERLKRVKVDVYVFGLVHVTVKIIMRLNSVPEFECICYPTDTMDLPEHMYLLPFRLRALELNRHAV